MNFLAAGRGELATRFASRGADKFAGVRVEASSQGLGAPILVDDNVAHAECSLHQVVEAGDHFVLIGHIEAASSSGGAPLMYLRRAYAAWPDPSLHRATKTSTVNRYGGETSDAVWHPDDVAGTNLGRFMAQRRGR